MSSDLLPVGEQSVDGRERDKERDRERKRERERGGEGREREVVFLFKIKNSLVKTIGRRSRL